MQIVYDLSTALSPILSSYPQDQVFILLAEGLPVEIRKQLTLPYPILVLPDGEQNKTLTSITRVWDFLLSHHATRHALLINIGGGTLTDMGGFAASTYKRGIDYLNLPTTLLAMVDASLGGKTGFDYQGIKNAIGTFSQPIDTLIYTPFLRTLPTEEWLSGWAEMLKHALLSSYSQWNTLLSCNFDLLVQTARMADATSECFHSFAALLRDSLSVKQSIIEQDAHEQGLRRALNFGHTIGHAIEAYLLAQFVAPTSHRQTQSSYLTPRHGYCILWGMIAELYLSVTHLDCPRQPLQQLTHLMLEYYGRPTCDCRHYETLLQYMLQDKKNISSGISFSLLYDLGRPALTQIVSHQDILAALDYLFSI